MPLSPIVSLVLALASPPEGANLAIVGGMLIDGHPGKLADLIVVDGNPLLSMRDLRNVVVVVKDGKVEKRDR